MRVERIKVADFGLSKMFTEEELMSQCGSPTYVAPEVMIVIPKLRRLTEIIGIIV